MGRAERVVCEGTLRRDLGEEAGKDHQADGADAAHADHLFFGGVFMNEAFVKIVDNVGRSPVEVGADGGHVGGDQGGDNDT